MESTAAKKRRENVWLNTPASPPGLDSVDPVLEYVERHFSHARSAGRNCWIEDLKESVRMRQSTIDFQAEGNFGPVDRERLEADELLLRLVTGKGIYGPDE